MEFHGGYLVPLSSNIALNLGFTHFSEVGELEYEYESSNGEKYICDD